MNISEFYLKKFNIQAAFLFVKKSYSQQPVVKSEIVWINEMYTFSIIYFFKKGSDR